MKQIKVGQLWAEADGNVFEVFDITEGTVYFFRLTEPKNHYYQELYSFVKYNKLVSG